MRFCNRKATALALMLFPTSFVAGQERAQPAKGIRQNTPRVHALVGASVFIAPGKRLDKASLVVRDGLIESVGVAIEIPDEARVWDLKGKTVYPGFVDPHTHFGLPDDGPSSPSPGHWNARVAPQNMASTSIEVDADEVKALRKLGFVGVAVVPRRGILRGQSALVNLSGKSLNESLYDASVNQHAAFDRRRIPGDNERYPVSLMGCIALIRQSLLDAQWYDSASRFHDEHPDQGQRPAMNEALAALSAALRDEQRFVFEAGDELDFSRIARVADEFRLPFAILGNGYEYRRLKLLKRLQAPLVVPLRFPTAPHVESQDQALEVSLEQLQHWELAPSNAAFLADRGIPFCLTTQYLKNPGKDFWKNLRTAVRRGLPERVALAALTTEPAKLLRAEHLLGSLQAGKLASFVVASGNLFTDNGAEIEAVWIEGDAHVESMGRVTDFRGAWNFDWQGVDGFAEGAIAGDIDAPSLNVGDARIKLRVNETELLAAPSARFFGLEEGDGAVRLHGYLEDDALSGAGVLPSGRQFVWSAQRVASHDPSSTAESDEDRSDEAGEEFEQEQSHPEQAVPPLVFNRYPAGAYGVVDNANCRHEYVLVQGATIWTSGAAGKLDDADMLVHNGKIVSVGHNLSAPERALRIDAKGKHLTAGLVDCHSHTAISGDMNEGTHVVTMEVRIGDVVNPADIALYRELAGGLTTANLLHGSANPMGGQNQVIKLRWGEDAEGMKFQGAKPGVKFALGENVARGNWGNRASGAYPQTRLGVEQLMRDTFAAARRYESDWRAHRSGSASPPPRRNLRLEAALEVLNGERIVHIHSYRQDEMLMFARLAKELDFTVGAFQHALEGYKVADALAEIGAGASSFSDWWAYKFEVYDAIPFNGALLAGAGVVTSFNSDSNELARRLNTEAAKAVKYGGVSEEEALQFVTLNPAIQLRIDDRVGSLEPGKDADFVLWNDHPLSTYAVAEQTWIDGRKYYDREEDAARQQRALEERERLTQLALKQRLPTVKLSTQSEPSDPGDQPDVQEPEARWTGLLEFHHHEEGAYHCGEGCHECTSFEHKEN